MFDILQMQLTKSLKFQETLDKYIMVQKDWVSVPKA